MAIEARNFDEKDVLISRFYALRAGLSVIAEETEKLRKANDEIRLLERKEEKQSQEVHDITHNKKFSTTWEEGEKREKLRKAEHSLNYQKDEAKNQLYEKQKELETIRNSYQKPTSFTLKIIILFVIIVFLIVCVVASGAGGTLVTIPILLWPLIHILKKRKQQQEQQERMEKLSAEIRQLKADVQRFTDQLVQVRQGIVSWEQSALNDAVKLQQQYQTQLQVTQQKFHREVIVPCTALAKEVREALLKDFSDVLTEADWENVDLLIFYLNTGRADNLKEALQLVDRQRQTDQICDSLEQASQYISSTLNANFQRLGTLIYHGMEQISSNITTMHRGIVQSIEHNNQYLNNLNQTLGDTNRQIGKLQEEVTSQGDKLLQAQYINNCLLNQSNRSSQDLMYELRYNQRYWIK